MNNADMPAYELTKREHAVIQYMNSMIANHQLDDQSLYEIADHAVVAANATFKALEDTE